MSITILNHPADLKIKVTGSTLKQVFLNLAQAMLKTLKKKIPAKPAKKRTLKLKSPNIQDLLINFLSQILCLADTYNEVYSQIKIINLTQTSLIAELSAVPINCFDTEIKAVTYAGEEIKKTQNGYTATVIFDI